MDKEATDSAFTSDGYFKTGDEGIIDGSGNIWITGRIKELIKTSGGFQCSPADVEAVLSKHPGIQDLACVGIYDEEESAEAPWLFVVPKDTKLLSEEASAQQAVVDALAHFCLEQLSYYKWPKYYSFVPSILKNPTGKVLRNALAASGVKRYLAPKLRQPSFAKL